MYTIKSEYDMIVGLDHIQLALPAKSEVGMRKFYCGLLGLPEIAKPLTLQARGGFWVQLGKMEMHFGVDPDFHPATKAHPAFVVEDVEVLSSHLEAAGHKITWDDALPHVKRFFTSDPVGNRIEFINQS